MHPDLFFIATTCSGEVWMLFPLALDEEGIDQVNKTFVLHGRDPAPSVCVVGNKLHFEIGGTDLQTLDIE